MHCSLLRWSLGRQDSWCSVNCHVVCIAVVFILDFCNNKKCVPAPGIEPGPPGWKPGILTTRPRRRCIEHVTIGMISLRLYCISSPIVSVKINMDMRGWVQGYPLADPGGAPPLVDKVIKGAKPGISVTCKYVSLIRWTKSGYDLRYSMINKPKKWHNNSKI